jgi:hypothetical protein
MKILGIIVAIAMAGPAGAAVKSYQGMGSYKMTDGTTGTYKLEVSEEAMDTKTKLYTKYTFNEEGQEKIVEYTMFKKQLEHGFFDLVDANDVNVGNGYCYAQKTQNKKSRVCHSEFKVQELAFEETAMIRGGRIDRMGSTVQAEMRLAYKEKLKLVVAQP